ncbi:class I glutamine amidotransferase-like protein [Hyaloscypha variabilis]|uniref:Class I glutamine amidotransferase-like protein n=1 Tax=Hyaloscypha variabilis (strain UAMH 11265 / GT02V1 / F) TaxID=1149755 RepID=A0A2J6RCF3_HYAVF|nr:class I glutamine amidotransferase-like protein [Hyaloscypha variabilis F]
MASLPLRIAILECDTPLPGTSSKYGGYGGVFTSLLNSATTALSLPPSSLSLSTYHVVTSPSNPTPTYPSLSQIDAILLTGSKHNSFDNDPWILKLVSFVEEVLRQRRVRIIGVCFGHQIVGRAMGTRVGRSERGWEVSVVPIELTEKGREIFGMKTLALHQMHRDVVFEYPDGVEELAYTDKCSVQGMYIPKRLITIQGHPEFNEEIVRELLVFRHQQKIFDDEVFEDAMARVDKYQDGVVVAKAFLKFLLE